MITWIQNSFQKHHKWLFGILLIVVIVTFVLTIGEQSFFGGHRPPERRALDYFGYDLAAERDSQRLFLGARISAALNPEDQFLFRDNLEDYAFSRAAALHLANQFGIPEPTDPQYLAYLRGKSVFHDEDGRFSQNRFLEFTDQIRRATRSSEGMIVRTIHEDWRITQLSKAIGGPGFAHPFEARMRHREEETLWEVQVASWSLDTFTPEIEPEEEELLDFYNENPQRYEIAEMIRVTAVQFAYEDFLDQVEQPSETAVREYYERNRARFQRPPPEPTEEDPDPEPRPTTLEDVHEEVVTAMKNDRARRLAAEAADFFTERLYRREITRDSEEFIAAVEDFQGELNPLDPYTMNRPPFQTGIPSRILQNAFNLTAEEFFSEIAQTRGGASVLVFDEHIPARVPPFEEVRDRVVEDFEVEERRRLFVEYGEEMRTFLQENVDFGHEFQDLAEEQEFTVESYGPFRGSEPPQGLNPRLLTTALALDPGQITPMFLQGRTGLFLYIQSKDSPEIDLDSPEVRETLAEMNEAMGTADAWILFHGIAMAEYERINPNTQRLP